MNISIDELSEAINRELTLYSKDVTDKLKKQAAKSIRELVKETKATAPVGHRKKHYKSSIRFKKLKEDMRGVTYVWYVNGSDYRLSHLLEDGHATRDGGRVEGTHFIKNATDKVIRDYEKAVEEAIKNG